LYTFWQKHALSEVEGNDNRFVEQNDSTLFHAYLGRENFATQEQADILNELYDQMRAYYLQTNPRRLRRDIEQSVDALFDTNTR